MIKDVFSCVHGDKQRKHTSIVEQVPQGSNPIIMRCAPNPSPYIDSRTQPQTPGAPKIVNHEHDRIIVNCNAAYGMDIGNQIHMPNDDSTMLVNAGIPIESDRWGRCEICL